MLTEEPELAHYAKDKGYLVTTNASKTGLGITLWPKQSDGVMTPIAFVSKFLTDTEKKLFNGDLETLAVV